MAKRQRKSLSQAAEEVRQSEAEAAPEVEEKPTPGRKRRGADKHRLNVNVEADLYDRFAELASRNGATMTFLVTQYMMRAVEDEDVMPWR